MKLTATFVFTVISILGSVFVYFDGKATAKQQEAIPNRVATIEKTQDSMQTNVDELKVKVAVQTNELNNQKQQLDRMEKKIDLLLETRAK